LGPTVPFWTLEISERAVTAVRVRRSGEAAIEVLSWWSAPVPEGATPLEIALRAVRRRGIREHGIHLVLPGRGAACRSARISPEDSDLPPDEMDRTLLDATPFDPEEAALRTRRLGAGGVLDFRVVAERRRAVDEAVAAFEQAGCPFLGVSLAPAAALAAREALLPDRSRGYLLGLQGSWTEFAAFDGALSVRYPVPSGLREVRLRFASGGSGSSGAVFEQALDATPGTPGGDAAVRALAAAFEGVAADLRRSVEFHRAAVRASGEEVLILTGPDAGRPGLRAALASISPVPIAPLPPLAGPVAAGPRANPEALAAAMPSLFVPLGAALGAAGAAPRDLDFRNLPDDLPEPRERTLLPAAAAALVVGMAGVALLAKDTEAAMARARQATSAPAVHGDAPVPPAPGSPGAAERADAEELARLVEDARRRAALGRALGTVVDAFPAGSGAFGAERIRVEKEKAGYRVRLSVRAPGGPKELAEAAGSLAAAGWRRVESGDGTLTVERSEPIRGPR
jgi:hypothetical protein